MGITQSKKMSLKYKDTCDIEQIQSILDKAGFKIGSIKINEEKKQIIVMGKYNEVSNKNKLVADLMKKAKITEIIEG